MTKLIAEIASCHNADMELAKAMARVIKSCGWDIFKTQSWIAKYVSSSDPDKKRYEKYQLTDANHQELKEYCEEIGLEYLTTLTRIERIPFLKKLGLKKVKLGSASFENEQLIEAAVENFQEVIISTGMNDVWEVEKIGGILRSSDTIMHCVSNYPLKITDANLYRIEEIKERREKNKHLYSVGYSDHTQGIETSVITMAQGVKYLEKHFTLSRSLPQTPHQMYDGGPYLTTHEISDEPETFRKINDWRVLIEKSKYESSRESREVTGLIQKRYENRY